MGDIDTPLPAGRLASWLSEFEEALRGGHPSVVPCDGCTACCTSSYFVLIEPDEGEALRRIPAEALVPAPRAPRGFQVLCFDERGHCPMLVDGRCSIYDHRPRTCRTYDCRVFTASGVDPGPGKEAIATRTRRWRFDPPEAPDEEETRSRQRALRAATDFLRRHRSELPDGPASTTELAVTAVEIHHLFLGPVAPDLAAVRRELDAKRG